MTDKMATLTEVKKYFGYKTAAAFSRDWKQLTEKDQNDLKRGIGNGSFDY